MDGFAIETVVPARMGKEKMGVGVGDWLLSVMSCRGRTACVRSVLATNPCGNRVDIMWKS